MASEELEPAERIGGGVPAQPDGDVVRVDADVQLGSRLIAVGIEGKREPGAERLVLPRPVQPGQMGVELP